MRGNGSRARVVVAGAGVGGITLANALVRRDPGLEVLLFDGHDDHLYQPGFVHLPLSPGRKAATRDTRPLLDPRVRFESGVRVYGVEEGPRRVALQDGRRLDYDFLAIASGSRVAPQQIPGFKEGGFHFHCRRRAATLQDAFAEFRGGDLILGATRTVSKCPAAAFEFALLVEDALRRDGRRGATRLHLVHPEAGLYPAHAGRRLFPRLLAERGIEVHAPFETASVDPERKEVTSTSGQALGYDLLILVPPHTGAPFVRDSGLATPEGWVSCDPRTLKVRDGLYVLGDAADLPAPKLGSAARLQAAVVAENISLESRGRRPSGDYDGSTLCVVETGRRYASVIRSRYGRTHVSKPGWLPYVAKRAMGRLYFRMIGK